MKRRDILSGLAVLAAASVSGCGAIATNPTRRDAIYIPGYYFGDTQPENEPADSARRRARGDKMTLITRIDAQGRITQAAFPVTGHDVAVAPDRGIGFFGQIGQTEGRTMAHHVAFDPGTLEMIGQGLAPDAGWRGGGHGVFLADGTLLTSERARLRPFTGRPADHYGRIVRRAPETLAILETLPCHGIDPHELRVMADGTTVAVANYGSVLRRGTAALGQPRHVVQACVTVLDLRSGALVARHMSTDPEHELRHLALGGDSILAIRARLGDEAADDGFQSALGEQPRDITAEPGESYLPAAPLLLSPRFVRSLDQTAPEADLRHGLSVEHDPVHDEFIASFPSSHRLIVFDACSGAVRRSLDTRTLGLRHPSGIALLPDGRHYAVAGYWRGLHVFERGSHTHQRRLSHNPVLYGHSHMTAA